MLAPHSNNVKNKGFNTLQKKTLTPATKVVDTQNIFLPSNLSVQAYFLSRLAPDFYKGGVLWFLPSSREVNQAKILTDFFLIPTRSAIKIFIFPEDFFAWHNASQQKTPSLLLVPSEHTLLSLPTPQSTLTHTIYLKIGTELKPIVFLRALEEAGFEPGPLPDATGWFSKKGGTITLATVNGWWHLSWQGDKLEKITSLNPVTETSGKPTNELILLPRKLEINYQTNLNDYLNASMTLVGGPENFTSKTKNNFRIKTFPSSNPFGHVPLFGKLWKEAVEFIANENKRQQEVTILTSEPGIISRQFTALPNKLKIVEINENVSAELEGFTDEASHHTYLTDHELIGKKNRHVRQNLAAFERLTKDDYLVHIDHGIGRFQGLVTQTIDSVRRDYFLIEYAESDKLYVPIEHTDRLSRYVGEPHPHLQRLHGASWYQITKKVKAETAKLARELLQLYAARKTSQVKPWQHFPEEEILASNFPHPLTPDQLKAWAEISADLDHTQPMDRLICGDVGFGKTELAVRAAFRAVMNKHQVALLVPTTILAQQHFDTFSERLEKLGTNLGILSRAQSAQDIKNTLTNLKSGKIDIIIGTHRLLAHDVHFKNLGLLIIDEEQRFGVKQKEELKALKPEIHVLSLSATPIPRTLHLAVSALRDLSIINTAPAGRQTIVTEFYAPDDTIITKAIKQELARNGQIYYLVNHIADLSKIQTKLLKLIPKLKLGIAHGRLSPKELAGTMQQFDEGKINLLLSTTIIENGLDLPNVNTLIVENAEKFGLADLYQLRGRVGRGKTRAYAYFLVQENHTALAEKRLLALAQAQNLGSGLNLALKDLELRGAGAILGREQHGQVSAVGLYLYGQLLAQAIEEIETGVNIKSIPEVLLRLPLEGRISSELIPDEIVRIQTYQRLASVREPNELKIITEKIIGRPLGDDVADRLLQNLLTILELKLLAEKSNLREIACQIKNNLGQFTLRFLTAPNEEIISRLTAFDNRWHKIETGWQATHPLAAGAWIPWLKQSLKTLN